MANPAEPEAQKVSWRPMQAYVFAAICLLIGILLGYLFRGSATGGARSQTATPASGPSSTTAGTGMPSLDDMRHMADKKAQPLLDKLKSDPKNAKLLIQIGSIYEATHQFKQAADYYQQSLNVDPKNVPVRTAMASCLYYDGNVDGAIAALQDALKFDPKDANSLFNLGFIRWKGKDDVQGAVSAWQELLKTNPALEPKKKSQVEKLIAEARLGGKPNSTE